MKLFKIFFIVDTGVNIEDHTIVLKSTDKTNAEQSFKTFMKSNLKYDESIKSYTVMEIPDEISVIYSSYENK